jgi:hypothetical protein
MLATSAIAALWQPHNDDLLRSAIERAGDLRLR